MSEKAPKLNDTDHPYLALETAEPAGFGRGWISGLIAAILGIVGLGTVLCFRFPDALVMPELRAHYPVTYLRAALHVVLVAAFVLGTTSLWLRRNKVMGLVGIGCTLIAGLLGGARLPVDGDARMGPLLGMDWFILNLVAYSALYIPLERLFAKYPKQPTFRKEWHVDLVYFFINSILVQVTTVLTLKPAMVFFDWARNPTVERHVSGWPILVQVGVLLLVADFAQYWVHRAFHVFPALWRFHAVHHSAEAMDWLAGSRLHLVDAVLTRGLAYVPIYVLGFSQSAIFAYLFIVAVQATFIHANVRWEFSWVRGFVATPCFHHWHHSAEPEAIDKNFAVHSPLWDWLFGTYHMPGRWPKSYGLCGHREVPSGWLRQFLYPFSRRLSKDVETRNLKP